MRSNVLKSSIEKATFTIICQVLFRCISFILNAYIIRTVGQDVLGIMNVRLLLLESTILFLSQEPIFKACLADTTSQNWAQIVNQVWISVPLCICISSVLVYIWINFLSTVDPVYLSQYKIGCYAMAVSCIIEQVTQVMVLASQSYCFVKLKVMLDTVYVISRTIIFVYFVHNNPSFALNAFSIAQVASSIILLLLYVGFFVWYISALNEFKKKELSKHAMFSDMTDFPFTSVKDFLPGVMANHQDSLLDKKTCLLTVSFLKQSAVKQILTEGEKYVMTISPVLTFSEQSMYDIVNNLGSLAARFIFRPIEESSYFYFTQMIKRDVPLEDQNQGKISESAEVVGQLGKIVTSIGLVIVVFGQSYSHAFLYLYGGKQLVEPDLPVLLMRYHSFAIVLLAVNGVTEGYVFATMDNQQIDRYNYLMVIFSIVFLLISYVFTCTIGPVGFILANCFNMSARIIHSIIFIRKRYKNTRHNPLIGFFPGKKFLSVLILSGILAKISEMVIYEKSLLLHISIGAVLFATVAFFWCLENLKSLKLGYDKYKRRVSLKMD
ncbi:unnamed protein product [Acanthoscelides obtectus]|uniref:Protein RFT1 homolog n=2 Tax=Acanthoscelides obtectus TaxID=200917 RepID=A0A9P0KCB4_ACAOB|nr:unnamed protein product [Acanthoscelides obtectus]CAK1672674.1 Protein RFT1 homolog [Acanthoscelides obtectus]